MRSRRRILRVRRDVWSPELLQFCRCACLTAPELENLEAEATRPTTTPQGSRPADLLDGARSSLCSASGDSKPTSSPSTVATARGTGCVQRSSTEATRIIPKDGGGDGNDPPIPGSLLVERKQNIARPDERQRRRGNRPYTEGERAISKDGGRERASEAGEGGGEGGGSVAAAAREDCRFPRKALSAQNEVATLAKAMDCFVQARDAFPTTLEHDEVPLKTCSIVQPTHHADMY